MQEKLVGDGAISKGCGQKTWCLDRAAEPLEKPRERTGGTGTGKSSSDLPSTSIRRFDSTIPWRGCFPAEPASASPSISSVPQQRDPLKPNQLSPVQGSTGKKPQALLSPLNCWRNLSSRIRSLFSFAVFVLRIMRHPMTSPHNPDQSNRFLLVDRMDLVQ